MNRGSPGSSSGSESGDPPRKHTFLRRGSNPRGKAIAYPDLTMRRKELRNSKLGSARPDGWSTLHFAAKEGNLRVVEDIMQHGSGDLVRLKAPDGSTPLHIAVLHGHIAVVEYLLRHHDTEVNARSHDGTPLDLAHNNRRKRLVAILSAAGGETFKYDPLSNLRASTGVQL